MRIDAHHHLWHYNDRDFAWIKDAAAALRCDFLPEEFEQVLTGANVDASIVVQARRDIQETHWLLECAKQSTRIAGVVGWAPLASPSLPAVLEVLSGNPHLVGFREIAQDQPAGFLLSPAFNDGIRRLTARDLPYDILIRARQLDEAIRFVDLHPRHRFVLDHAAKPQIALGQLEPWRSSLRELARRSNVMCKLSGMVTEANWQRWTEDDLHPYLETCLEAFGAERCMAGSDWPVCLVATTYKRWWQVLDRWLDPLSREEREQILSQTAHSFYRPNLLNSSEPVVTP